MAFEVVEAAVVVLLVEVDLEADKRQLKVRNGVSRTRRNEAEFDDAGLAAELGEVPPVSLELVPVAAAAAVPVPDPLDDAVGSDSSPLLAAPDVLSVPPSPPPAPFVDPNPPWLAEATLSDPDPVPVAAAVGLAVTPEEVVDAALSREIRHQAPPPAKSRRRSTTPTVIQIPCCLAACRPRGLAPPM